MYLLLLYSCFISFFISILYGKNVGSFGITKLVICMMFFCNFCSIYLFYEVCCLQVPCYLDLISWINIDYLSISYSFVFDSLTVTMLFIISSVSLFAHIYSIDYMKLDAHFIRFLSFLSLFTFCMILLVTSNNLLQLFIGWEGVGLCSYLLINFWYTRIQANKAALKALFINKISDLCLLFGIALIYLLFFSIDFNVIYMPIIYFCNTNIFLFNTNISIFFVVCLLLFMGAMGKSAQIGFHVWLPDAMEGPTPVSSLIHAATMVTAGVFLIIRTSFFFEYVNNISLVVLLVGSITIFFASTIGIFQNDIKKVIAYSTCSQIGYMVFICGYSGYAISMFHLFNHAFFKALLFLTAGAIIHSLGIEQDIRKMGGLIKLIPFSYFSFFIGSFSLMGFPFFTGYYSKDLIIEFTYLFMHEFVVKYAFSIFFIKIFYWLVLISIIFTSIYSIRLISFVFLGRYNGYSVVVASIHELSGYMNIVLFILSLFSIFIGFISKDMMVGLGTDFWSNSFFVQYLNDYEYNFKYLKLLPVIYSLYGIIMYCLLYNYCKLYYILYLYQIYPFFYKKLYFFNLRWYFDKIYNDYFINYFLLEYSYSVLYKLFDKGIIEFIGPYGILKILNCNMQLFYRLQTGFIYHYAGIVLNVIVVFFCIIFLKNIFNISLYS